MLIMIKGKKAQWCFSYEKCTRYFAIEENHRLVVGDTFKVTVHRITKGAAEEFEFQS